MAVMIDYHSSLGRLRRKPTVDGDASPKVIYRTVKTLNGEHNPHYDASVQDKVERFFGEGAHYFIVNLEWDDDGEIVVPFDLSKIHVCVGPPGEKRLKCVYAPNWDDSKDVNDNLKDFGIAVKDSPKLQKRLGRILGASHTGAVEGARPRIWRGDKGGPEKVTDGFAFISGEMYKKATGKECKNFHAVQFSYLGPEGLLKGTGVIVHNLPHDISVSHWNLKDEIKEVPSEGEKRVLYIEQDFKAKPARTDLQTIVNNGWGNLLSSLIHDMLEDIETLGGSWSIINDWLHHDYAEYDWYEEACANAAAKGKEKPVQLVESCARQNGIHANLSPHVRERAFRAACRLLDIRGVKVPFDKGTSVRGYIVPDLSLFAADGSYKGNGTLKSGQIAAPLVARDEAYLIYRQPNAMREIVTAINVAPKYESDVLIQINEHDMLREDGNWLELWGGADHDDSVILLNDPDAWRDHWENERNWGNMAIPHLESLIDEAVQLGSGNLSIMSQANATMSKTNLTLGQAINFLMNLVLCEQWDWYQEVIEAESLSALYSIYERYHDEDDSPILYADVFAYKDQFTREKHCRVPIKNFENKEEGIPFEYLEVQKVETKLGKMLQEAADRMEEILNVDHHTDSIIQDTWLRQKNVLSWFARACKSDKARKLAGVLHNVYLCLMWQRYSVPEGFEWLFQEAQAMKEESFFERIAFWNEVAGRILAAHEEVARQIVAYTAVLEISPRRRKQRDGSYRVSKGSDKLVWNLSTRPYWVSALKLFQEHKGITA